MTFKTPSLSSNYGHQHCLPTSMCNIPLYVICPFFFFLMFIENGKKKSIKKINPISYLYFTCWGERTVLRAIYTLTRVLADIGRDQTELVSTAGGVLAWVSYFWVSQTKTREKQTMDWFRHRKNHDVFTLQLLQLTRLCTKLTGLESICQNEDIVPDIFCLFSSFNKTNFKERAIFTN